MQVAGYYSVQSREHSTPRYLSLYLGTQYLTRYSVGQQTLQNPKEKEQKKNLPARVSQLLFHRPGRTVNTELHSVRTDRSDLETVAGFDPARNKAFVHPLLETNKASWRDGTYSQWQQKVTRFTRKGFFCLRNTKLTLYVQRGRIIEGVYPSKSSSQL